MAVQVTIQDYAKAINSSWRKTTDSVLETARLCAEADKKLPTDQKNKLVRDLDFNKATFSKLAKIGSQPRLQTESVKSLLPPNYTIVYEVAKLPESDLQVAIKEGVITPKMSRGDLDAWLERRAGKVPTSESEHAKIIATVEVPSDYDPKKQALLEKALEKLRLQFGFSLERPRDPEEMAYNRMAARVDDHIRKEARRFIHTLKTSRIQSAGRISAAERKSLWPFTDDELAIAPDATWDQVKAALELVGNADEFERLRDEALRLCGVPEERVSDHPIIDHDEAMVEIRAAMQEARRAHGSSQRGAASSVTTH